MCFNGSLRENLLLAKPAGSDEEFSEVLEKVGLEALLEGKGLDTWLGEGGRQISGGERRRIGIARALLHDAPILLMDEPTEGLDRRTEQQIMSLLLEHAKDKTVLFITHRLVGLEHMDHICLMDEGEIIEQGKHQALLKEKWPLHRALAAYLAILLGIYLRNEKREPLGSRFFIPDIW